MQYWRNSSVILWRPAQPFFVVRENFAKIWSVCGQHEVQYVKSGMYKYTFNYIYILLLFFYTLYTLKIY
jgi:hypothetical protein